MRISDWSSDVCSSDLKAGLPFENELREKIRSHITRFGKFEGLKGRSYQEAALVDLQEALGWNSYYIDEWPVQKAGLAPDQIQITGSMHLDASKCGLRARKSAVQGKSVSVRVDHGGRHNIKKKKQH